MFLDLGQDGDHREAEAEDHVEGDEELVDLALSGVATCVVDEEQDESGEGSGVHEEGAGEEGSKPPFIVFFLVVSIPGLCPAMSEVNDENELDDDEKESSDHAEVHPDFSERSLRNPEGSDHAGNDDDVLDAPEAVLDASSGIFGALHVDHYHRHQNEEQRHHQA